MFGAWAPPWTWLGSTTLLQAPSCSRDCIIQLQYLCACACIWAILNSKLHTFLFAFDNGHLQNDLHCVCPLQYGPCHMLLCSGIVTFPAMSLDRTRDMPSPRPPRTFLLCSLICTWLAMYSSFIYQSTQLWMNPYKMFLIDRLWKWSGLNWPPFPLDTASQWPL